MISARYGKETSCSGATAASARRDASIETTAAMMSMTGFATRPGTAVLPTCSMRYRGWSDQSWRQGERRKVRRWVAAIADTGREIEPTGRAGANESNVNGLVLARGAGYLD